MARDRLSPRPPRTPPERATAGRAAAGRATAGRPTAARATAGRATAGRPTAGRGNGTGRTGGSAADDGVTRYLTEFGALLHGPRHTRDAILAEIDDGLHQAVEAHLANGAALEQAVEAAIAGFGTPRAVAAAFAAELSVAQARQTIIAFLLTGPLVGIWWLLLFDPQPWRTGPAALITAIPAVPLVAAGTALAAAAIATTGRLIRWLPETGATRALGAATAIAVICLAGDLADLGLLGIHAAFGGIRSESLASAAAAAGLARVAYSCRSLHHHAQLRRRAIH